MKMEIMKKYKAIRLSLTQAQIFENNDKSICTIEWPSTKIWRTENAPLSDALSSNLQSNPTLKIGDQKFTAKRKLLTDKFFFNQYEISLHDEKNNVPLVSLDPGAKWVINIEFEGKKYQLKRNGFFQFNFTLEENGHKVLEMTNKTPFFTISSRMEFQICANESISPILISFSFFYAHNWFF